MATTRLNRSCMMRGAIDEIVWKEVMTMVRGLRSHRGSSTIRVSIDDYIINPPIMLQVPIACWGPSCNLAPSWIIEGPPSLPPTSLLYGWVQPEETLIHHASLHYTSTLCYQLLCLLKEWPSTTLMVVITQPVVSGQFEFECGGGGVTPCRHLRPSSGREHTVV